MTTLLAPLPVQAFKDSNGNPLSGGQLYTYVAGTSTLITTYTDVTSATPNTNPIILNSRGECNVWLTSGLAYKLVLQDSYGVLIWSVDQITSAAAAGANSDITSLTGLTTPLTIPQGGTGASTAGAALTALGAAASGANADITSLGVVTSINGGPVGSLRNRIRNGGCRISQEGGVAAVQGVYTYGGADGHCISVNGTLTGATIIQLNSGPSVGVQGFSQALSNTTVTTSGSAFFQHRIAAKNVADLNNKIITISCKVFQDTGVSITAVQLALNKPSTSADTFSAQTTLQSSAGLTVPSGVLTQLTFTTTVLGSTDASLGLAAQLFIPFASAISSKNFTVTDWQLEGGPIATAFDALVPLEIDDFRCKQTLECFSVGAIDFIGSNFQAGQNNFYTMPMKVQKRAPPTSVSGSYTLVNTAAPTVAVIFAENVALTTVNTAAGQWRITNNTIAKIRCDL